MTEQTCEHYKNRRCLETDDYCFYNANYELCIQDRLQALGEARKTNGHRKTFFERYGVRQYREILEGGRR